MRASNIVPGIVLGSALASTASAQTVIQHTITQEPVETTVTQTPAGTIVTRRPVGAATEEVVPNTIDAITTREVVRRAEVTRTAPRAPQRTTRTISAAQPAKKVTATAQRRVTQRLALTPAERHIVYQTIVEREVLPVQRVVPPSAYVVPQAQYVAPPLVSAQVALPTAPVVAQEEVVTPAYAVGSVLPASTPLYAVPQDVALRVPAVQRYGYAYLGGRAYLVDPATDVIVEDVTE
jgi:hypothetical protein